MIPDLRVCFVGDSLIAGVGDPEHLGWVGRLAARSHRTGQPLTAYNLGVRGQTSGDLLVRWQAECTLRLPEGSPGRVVLSCGVNDTVAHATGSRVALRDSAVNLAGLVAAASAQGWPVLVVGPAPVHDEAHNGRLAELDHTFAGVCATAAAHYVAVFAPLRERPAWAAEVAAGDGAHPGAAGYQLLAELIWPGWHAWTAEAVPAPA